MKMKLAYSVLLCISITLLTSCENEAERKQREANEEQQRIELKREAEELALRQEQEKIEREAQIEKDRQERVIYEKYINNSLSTGSVPYSYCFGGNRSCSDYGCSEIIVRTPFNSDVVVTIKKNGKVYRHAYIKQASSYTFEVPNGAYQPFFYYGRGWNPEKIMKEADCGTLKGGFITDEHFGKDGPQSLTNNILEYELILQQNGNFSTRPSSSDEAF